jgi:hypothetical protein
MLVLRQVFLYNEYDPSVEAAGKAGQPLSIHLADYSNGKGIHSYDLINA